MAARDRDGHCVYPEAFDAETLDALREDDPVFFAAQYLLKPGGGGASDFNAEWLKPFEWEGTKQISFKDNDGKTHFERLHELHCTISVDPAISDKGTADRSAIVVTGSDGERIFLLDTWAGRVGATDLAARVLETYREYNANRIVIETVAYQEALAEIITLLAQQAGMEQLPIAEHKTGSDHKKRIRILGLEPYFRKGLFYWNAKTQSNFFDEYISYPHVKHKDILDALSFQKDVWERLLTKGRTGRDGGILREWKQRDNERAMRIRASMGKRR
jgi:predicted phage terminase large subunit-like protein